MPASIELTQTVTFSEEEVTELMDTTYEMADVAYWGDIYKRSIGGDPLIVIREHDTQTLEILDSVRILRALADLVQKKVKVSRRLSRDAASVLHRKELGDLDGTLADVVVQIAALGEIRYG